MERASDAVLVERVRGGDTAAFAPLFDRWYDRAYNVARAIVRQPELAADVAQDAFVSAWQRIDRLDDVHAFGGWLLRITRNRALDVLRREAHSTATEATTLTGLQDRGSPDGVPVGPSPVEAAEAAETEALLWAASAALGERDASLLDLHLRHGLTPSELADDLGVTPNHAHQLLFRLRQRLEEAIGSFLLWNGGAPRCEAMATTIGAAFDATTVSAVRRHERGCPTCRDERRRMTDPAKLFAAVPLVLAPLGLRARTAHGLAADGVPMPPELTSIDPPAAADGAAGTQPSTLPPPEHGTAVDGTGTPPTARRARRWAVGAAVGLLIVATTSLVLADAARAPVAEVTDVATTAPVGTTVDSAVTTTDASTTTSTGPSTTTSTTTTLAAVVVSSDVPAAGEPAAAEPPAAPPPVVQPTPPAPAPDPAPPPPPAPATTPLPPPPSTTPPPPPPSTLPPPLPPPSPPPTIVRFTFVAASHRCEPALAPRAVAWLTEGATRATVSWRGRSASVPPSGRLELCLAAGDAVTLLATSDGGTDTATVTAV